MLHERPGNRCGLKRSDRTACRTGGGRAALGAAFLFATFNLRPAIAAVSPILPTIRTSDALSPATAGMLTSIPVLSFGAAALFAPRLVRRRGMGWVLLICLAVLVGGITVRSAPTLVSLFGGTLLIGASVGVCNVLMPRLVKRDFPQHVALMTGLYTTMLSLGPSAGAGLTVPIDRALGDNWRLSLGVWAPLAAAALCCWFPFRRHDAPDLDLQAPLPGRKSVWKSGPAWALSIYMGLQSANFYTVLTWLPTILQRRGMSAFGTGTLLAMLNLVAIAASMLAPAISERLGNQWMVATLTAAVNAGGTVGLITDGHHLQYLWATCIGIGQGSAISLAFMMMVVRAGDSVEATALSGMAQGVGYLLGAGGPVLAGALFNASGSWGLPLRGLVLLLAVQMIAAFWAGQPTGTVRIPGVLASTHETSS
jgi:CP family cyanate transporter-like MFS transporter